MLCWYSFLWWLFVDSFVCFLIWSLVGCILLCGFLLVAVGHFLSQGGELM